MHSGPKEGCQTIMSHFHLSLSLSPCLISPTHSIAPHLAIVGAAAAFATRSLCLIRHRNLVRIDRSTKVSLRKMYLQDSSGRPALHPTRDVAQVFFLKIGFSSFLRRRSNSRNSAQRRQHPIGRMNDRVQGKTTKAATPTTSAVAASRTRTATSTAIAR